MIEAKGRWRKLLLLATYCYIADCSLPISYGPFPVFESMSKNNVLFQLRKYLPSSHCCIGIVNVIKNVSNNVESNVTVRLMLKNQKSTTHIVRCLEVMFQRPHYKLIKSWKTVKVYKRKK